MGFWDGVLPPGSFFVCARCLLRGDCDDGDVVMENQG